MASFVIVLSFFVDLHHAQSQVRTDDLRNLALRLAGGPRKHETVAAIRAANLLNLVFFAELNSNLPNRFRT